MANMQHWQFGVRGVGVEFRAPIDTFPPAVAGVSNPDGNGHNRIPARLHRLLQEPHPGLLRRAAALLVVAPPAGSHDIFPGLSPSLGNRNDVIERQFLGPELVTAVLAGIALSLIYTSPSPRDRQKSRMPSSA